MILTNTIVILYMQSWMDIDQRDHSELEEFHPFLNGHHSGKKKICFLEEILLTQSYSLKEIFYCDWGAQDVFWSEWSPLEIYQSKEHKESKQIKRYSFIFQKQYNLKHRFGYYHKIYHSTSLF